MVHHVLKSEYIVYPVRVSIGLHIMYGHSLTDYVSYESSPITMIHVLYKIGPTYSTYDRISNAANLHTIDALVHRLC